MGEGEVRSEAPSGAPERIEESLIRRAARQVRAHFIKIVSGLGIGLLSLDIAGFADTIKNAADRFIPGGKAAQWVGVALFALTLIRAVVFTYAQKKADKP